MGAAFLSRRAWSIRHLVGNDIGCGMALWQSDLRVRKIKLDKFVKKLTGLDDPWDGDATERLEARGVPARLASPSLGTIGGGNHFAELQRVDTVEDEAAFDGLGLDRTAAQVLVHSGRAASARPFCAPMSTGTVPAAWRPAATTSPAISPLMTTPWPGPRSIAK